MRIEVVHTREGSHIWRFRAPNGRITANNETFDNRSNAMRAAKAVVRSIYKMVGSNPSFESEKPFVKDGETITIIFFS